LPELLAILIIAGVLAAVAVPRLTRSGFDEARLHGETVAALRYAQRTAIAYQRIICATFTGTQLTLTYASAYGSSTCDTNLAPPGGTGPSGLYQVTAAGGASYSAALSFTFDRVGKPSPGQTITLSDGRTITVEAETGYVH
jgi:MSHA pilin protein MshC